jgi:hypothetical protein
MNGWIIIGAAAIVLLFAGVYIAWVLRSEAKR